MKIRMSVRICQDTYVTQYAAIILCCIYMFGV